MLKIEISQDQADMLVGILQHTQEKLGMEDSMEYGPDIEELITKLGGTQC